jgi:nucleoid DNA-binding protein
LAFLGGEPITLSGVYLCLIDLLLAKRLGRDLQITGFGKFSVRERKAREGRNPRTGQKMKIAAQKVPAFSAGNVLKEAV